MITAAASSPTGADSTGASLERFWATSGIQFALLCIIAYAIYGHQPEVGTVAGAVVAFYHGERTRILLAAIFSGMAVLYLLWFGAALRSTLAAVGQEGWAAAATAASAALGALFLLQIAVMAILAYSIAGSGNDALVSGLNDFEWAGVVLSSFPRAMLVMAGAFGLWRAGLIPNALFGVGFAAIVLVLLGGTTWLSGGFWAPDGAYSRFISPLIGLVWVLIASGALLAHRPTGRTGW
jgi:hypothetical protein